MAVYLPAPTLIHEPDLCGRRLVFSKQCVAATVSKVSATAPHKILLVTLFSLMLLSYLEEDLDTAWSRWVMTLNCVGQ